MKTIKKIDVTQIEPRLKHPTIFQNFHDLSAGESLVIHNDHDPKPLYYQLLAEYGKRFTWTYLESGPTVWEVEITKTVEDGDTVGELVTKDYRKADVFKKFGIDFCCGGNISLKEASQQAGISLEELEAALEKAETVSSAPSENFDKWTLDFLADFITNTHHQYVKETAPILKELSNKVAMTHGNQRPELHDLSQKVHSLMDDLIDHVGKEEAGIFPAIKQLVERRKINNDKTNDADIDALIKAMHEEHDHAGEDLRYCRSVTNDYTLPAGACNSHMYLYEKLKEFEDDLFRHIHLENNILFPKSIALQNA